MKMNTNGNLKFIEHLLYATTVLSIFHELSVKILRDGHYCSSTDEEMQLLVVEPELEFNLVTKA